MLNASDFYWVMPTNNDVDRLGTWPLTGEEMSAELIRKVACASEEAAHAGILIPTSFDADVDSLTASTLALNSTRSLTALTAIRPQQIHPAQMAKWVAANVRLFPSRLALNVVSGKWDYDDSWFGLSDNSNVRYERTAEWITVFRQIIETNQVDFSGQHFQAKSSAPLWPQVESDIPIWLPTGPPDAQATAEAHADVLVMHGDTTDRIQRLINSSNPKRNARFALRAEIVVRPTHEEAMRAAESLIDSVHPTVRNEMRLRNKRMEPEVGYIAPHLWNGLGTARLGTSVAVVGDPDQVIDQFEQWKQAGIDFFVVSGFPKHAEALNFCSSLLPLLATEGATPTMSSIQKSSN